MKDNKKRGMHEKSYSNTSRKGAGQRGEMRQSGRNKSDEEDKNGQGVEEDGKKET